MKKLGLIISALALVFGLSQCKKPNMPGINYGNGTQHVVLKASFDNGNSKIDQNGAGLKWTKDTDKIIVIKDETQIGELTCKSTDGTFEGNITPVEGNIIFKYGAPQTDFKNQSGLLKDAVYLVSPETPYSSDGGYVVTMTMPGQAVLKLDLSAFAPATGSTAVSIKAGNPIAEVASVNGITTASTAVYVAMQAAESREYTFSGNGKTAKKTWNLLENKFYTKDVEGNPSGEAIVINVQSLHEYVDLGLSVCWATTNIGAEKPEDYGNYYAWGEVETKTTYSESTYKYGNTEGYEYIQYTKYNATDGRDVLEVTELVIDDAAICNWGGDWRMPTKAEADELVDNTKCQWTWINDKANNKVGYQIVSKVEGYEGNSIFVPAAGYRKGESMYLNETEVRLWTTKLIIPSEDPEYHPYGAGNMIYGTSTAKWVQGWNRFIGFPIRPVCPRTGK